MMPIPFIAIVPGLVLAALTPAKVTDEKTDSSAMRSVHQPKVIYVKSFSIRAAASQSDDSRRKRTSSRSGRREKSLRCRGQVRNEQERA